MQKVIQEALQRDRTIDIITLGARTGLERTTEIWFHNINGRIIICGTPGGVGGNGITPRDWLANLKANPEFRFRLKETVDAELPARARIITDPRERRSIMSAPATDWYRQQGYSMQELVEGSPIVEVQFLEPDT